MTSITQKPPAQSHTRARKVGYWFATAITAFELLQGALWDFNLVNKGYVDNILTHLGYPLYLGPVLGISKVAAAVVILMPGFYLLKEWAYAGTVILFTGAITSHLIVGDGVEQAIWPLLFGLLALTSWKLHYKTPYHHFRYVKDKGTL